MQRALPYWLSLSVSWAAGLAACGRPEGPDADARDASVDAPAEADAGAPDGFAPLDGLNPGGRARRIGQDFWVGARALLPAAGGASWLFWHGYSSPDFSHAAQRLELFSAAGVLVRDSALAASSPDGVVLHGDESLGAFRNRCGLLQSDTCFYRDALAGEIVESVWPAAGRTALRYSLDWDGNVAGSEERVFEERHLTSAAARESGLYALARHGGYVVSRLDETYAPLWSVELFPSVRAPELPLDAPLEDLLNAADLAQQLATGLVRVSDGVAVAATVGRGTLAALNQARGLDLALPTDPRCADVVVALLPDSGAEPRYFSIPTPECEALPQLAVVAGHAVTASAVQVPRPPEPNDTHQYDIALGIVELSTGRVFTRRIDLAEDDLVHAVAPCGAERACLAGTSGAKSVDTGSVVSFGKGFVLPVSLTAEPGEPWLLTSARHSEIRQLAATPNGLLFFATVDGPITHTADHDPLLGANRALLGVIEGL